MGHIENLELKQPTGMSPFPREGRTVLVAEDDAISRRILEVCLDRWGYRVLATDNGFRALEAIQMHNAPGLLLLDWMMPGIDGVELCRRIRAMNKPIYPYIVLLTARDAKTDLITGLNAGADDYLTKPFNADELHARLRAGDRILALQNELIQAREQLRFQATHDSMTGVWNRKGIMELLANELARARRSREPLAVMMIDLDHFKSVNDTFGHVIGDAVLKEVASRLSHSVRTYDLVGRYGGEEFLIILSNASLAEAQARAQHLCAVVRDTPVKSQPAMVKITISVGATQAPVDGDVSETQLLHIADKALYEAKKQGRNRVEVAVYQDSKVESPA